MDFSPKDKQRKERNSISTGIKIENLFPRTTVECVTYLIIYQIIVGQPVRHGEDVKWFIPAILKLLP
jgi:hypothetical protein